jgi:hypothetical protein
MPRKITIKVGTGKSAKVFVKVAAAKKYADKTGGKLTIRVC